MANGNNNYHLAKYNKEIQWLPKKQKQPFDKWLLVVFATLTAIMAFLAMLNLIPEQGAIGYAKAGIVAVSAGLVSYAINRFAIERGAELAATGFSLAIVVSVFSMLFVGTGLFASTYAGLTISSVNELRLQQYGQELSRYVSVRNERATQATRTIPVVNASASDFRAHAECEAESSCISGRGNGGRGPVSRKLEEVASRADAISKQLSDGEDSRQAILSNLNSLIGKYQTTLGSGDKSMAERRQLLTRIVAEIDQSLSALDEAVPVSLLQAYAQELETGVMIPERVAATNAVNALLSKHGRSLGSVLASLENRISGEPVFPAQAGVSTTFSYIGHFMPIAALTACIELILPLSLWLFTFLAIVWEKHLRDPEHEDNRTINRPAESRAPENIQQLDHNAQPTKHGNNSFNRHNHRQGRET